MIVRQDGWGIEFSGLIAGRGLVDDEIMGVFGDMAAPAGSTAEDNDSDEEVSEVPTSDGTDGQGEWTDSAMKNLSVIRI